MAERLATRGLHCVEDLAYLLPLGYQDRRAIKPLNEIEEGEEALVEGVVKSFRSSWFRRRYNAKMVVQTVGADGEPGEEIEARWFHPVGGLNDRTKSGVTVLLAGPVKSYRGKRSMVHPIVIDPEAGPPGIAMRYPQVEGVGAATLAKACRGAIDFLDEAGAFEEALPAPLLKAHRLVSQREALFALHSPDPDISEADMRALAERRSPAHRRLAFEEFFFLQLGLLGSRREWTRGGCAFTGIEGLEPEFLRACLPFEPTGAQWRVINELFDEMASDEPMLRLVQGDVGSGKTVVAFAAALAVARAGGQVALMAPTEILAGQHMRTLEAWCTKAGMRVALLTGSTPRAQRNSTLALLAGGQVDLLIGTHALIVGDVNFKQLALVIVDEQHRFGVEQRAALRDKGGHPHLMVMTATPIPRSLALTAFGELEGSVIDELPPGRQPADTKLFTGKRGLAKARQLVVDAVRGGARAFVVCPLVEASEAVDASDVDATAEVMRELLSDADAVSVVHGRMKSADKEAAMDDFRAGRTKVLVATTVIEVGVDVPEATLMLVEHAERFGLAQLHQLRGRVGRGQGASSCFLHTASGRDSEAGRRLRVMEEHSDGFLVAEKDLEIRGPGEVFGTRQSGMPKLRFASFSAEGLLLLEAARSAARDIRDADPELKSHPRLAEELRLRIARGAVFAAESG
jgi:ATP-dependent DNA helicase RecG